MSIECLSDITSTVLVLLQDTIPKINNKEGINIFAIAIREHINFCISQIVLLELIRLNNSTANNWSMVQGYSGVYTKLNKFID